MKTKTEDFKFFLRYDKCIYKIIKYIIIERSEKFLQTKQILD